MTSRRHPTVLDPLHPRVLETRGTGGTRRREHVAVLVAVPVGRGEHHDVGDIVDKARAGATTQAVAVTHGASEKMVGAGVVQHTRVEQRPVAGHRASLDDRAGPATAGPGVAGSRLPRYRARHLLLGRSDDDTRGIDTMRPQLKPLRWWMAMSAKADPRELLRRYAGQPDPAPTRLSQDGQRRVQPGRHRRRRTHTAAVTGRVPHRAVVAGHRDQRRRPHRLGDRRGARAAPAGRTASRSTGGSRTPASPRSATSTSSSTSATPPPARWSCWPRPATSTPGNDGAC